MELRHLRYFVAVAEEQNITRAAARLHVSQPPLSRQIRDLEDELGVALLIRSAKSVQLTPEGVMFARGAREILRMADDVVAQVRAAAGLTASTLQVGYAPSLTVDLLPGALRSYQEVAPDSSVTLHDLSTAEMVEWLLDARLDVALMIRPRHALPKPLEYQEVGQFPVAVALSRGHRLGQGTAPTLADVCRERILAYGCDGYPEYCDWLQRLIGLGHRAAEVFDSSSSLLAAVEAGRGVALVPECFRGFAGGRLEVRVLEDALEPFIVVAAVRRDASAAARLFLRAFTRKSV